MAIKIGTVSTLGHPINWNVLPDDRQVVVKTLDAPGVVVIDNGYFEAGDNYQFTAIFRPEAWTVVKGYCTSRTKVDVVLENGTTLSSRRVVIKSYGTPDKMFPTHVQASLELWGA